MGNFIVRKVAVLGAGVMGAQIAAQLVNAQVDVVFFDLPAKDGPKNGIVMKAIDALRKLNPAPLGHADLAAFIVAANYDEDLELLRGCDLVIEAIAERIDWKHDLYRKVGAVCRGNAIFATNTSGLSIGKLSEGVDAALRKRFCGVHFFNPPRYMHLVELIATPRHRPGDRRPARDLSDDDPGQGLRARQGHAEFHRQPDRHLRHVRHGRGGCQMAA